MKRSRLRRILPLLAAALAVGCDAPLTVSQKLEGDWVGRPESAAERTVREWPTLSLNPDDPEIAAAAAEAPPTDLESFETVRVEMRLGPTHEARLSLAGAEPLEGKWSVSAAEGRRAVLEISVKRGADGEGTLESRRFDVEVLKQGEGFVLREQGADRRFGRLLFRRPGAEATATDPISD